MRNSQSVFEGGPTPEKIEEAKWARSGFSIIETQAIPNLFEHSDHAIIRREVWRLPRPEREVVILRFWGRLDLPQIADTLGLQVRAVDHLLGLAFAKLRRACLEDSGFSRAEDQAEPYLAAA